MIVIGVVFLVLAVLGAGAAVEAGHDVNVHLDSFGVSATVSVLWVFCAGAVAMLLLLISLAAFRRAARRRRKQRRELKQLRAEEAAAADNRAANRDDAVDVRDDRTDDIPASGTGAHAMPDPEAERRYIPGEERV